MSDALEKLIEALRDELKQYGEMLALLDLQQERVIGRAADDLLQSVTDIQTQSAAIQNARAHRERCHQELNRAAGMAADTSFSDLMPRLPADYQPLVKALVDENNELLVRVKQRSRQNHMLLSRSVEMMQRLMSALVPGVSPVYTEQGVVTGNFNPGHTLYEAVG